MKKAIDILTGRLEERKASMLVTVVQKTGSAPGRRGAMMLVGEEGYITGTIGGGMLEYRCTALAQDDLKAEKGMLRQYRLTKEEAAGLGMVCGGDVDVLFSIVLPTEKSVTEVKKIQECMEQYEKGWMLLPMNGSGIEFRRSWAGENGQDDLYYARNLENESRVYIFGGGHLAQELVPLLSHLGFRCVVTDDRPEFSTKELFPQAEEVYTCAFDQLDGKFKIYEGDYIIAMTRGHVGDMNVEKFAMRTSAHYIGVVGSRSKIAAVNAQLKDAGFTEADLNRIVTPIGLDIHSDTPAEIAVSIAAQLIERRALYKMQKRG